MVQHVEHAIAPAGDGTGEQGFHALVAVSQGAQQHRQVDPAMPSTRPGSSSLSARLDGVAPEISVSTSTPLPLSTSASVWRASASRVRRVVLRRDVAAKLVEQGRALVQHVAGVLYERLATAAVDAQPEGVDLHGDSNPERRPASVLQRLDVVSSFQPWR